jgi:hypothetical protein
MSRVFKIDLHTHPLEALKAQFGIQGIRDIKVGVAEVIVKAVKKAGLNGIAITERNNFNQSWVAALQILDHFKGDNVVILPGEELDYAGQKLLHIYVPDYYRRRMPFFQGKEWVMILAQPGLVTPLELDKMNDIKLDAVEGTSLKGEFEPAGRVAMEKCIPVIKASDSVELADIGKFYTELEWK